MNKLPSDIIAHFDAKRQEQQQYVLTAEVQRNVRNVYAKTLQLMDKYIARSIQMDDTEARVTQLEEQSRDFLITTQQANRCNYTAWCCWCWWCPLTLAQQPLQHRPKYRRRKG
jgi:hypothetical protein